MLVSTRLRIIGLCAVFNILFEYSARGVTEFTHRPLLFLAMFGIYFTFFTMIEDLIVRYRLKNYQISLIALLYGFIPEMWLTGNLFNKTTYLGISILGVNLGTILFINICAWGVLQSIVTLYFANRIQKRDWGHRRMGKVGWALCIGYQVLVITVARSNIYRPRGALISYIAVFLVMIVIAIPIIKSISKREPWKFQSSQVMDFLAFGSVVLFLILGTFVQGPKVITSQPLNHTAAVLENLWTLFVGIVFFVYRWYRGSDVTV